MGPTVDCRLWLENCEAAATEEAFDLLSDIVYPTY